MEYGNADDWNAWVNAAGSKSMMAVPAYVSLFHDAAAAAQSLTRSHLSVWIMSPAILPRIHTQGLFGLVSRLVY
jgi:hypothetical protein